MADLTKRTSFYPQFYRVSFQTVAGLHWVDCLSLAEAKKVAKRESSQFGRARILACWENTENRYALDTENVPW